MFIIKIFKFVGYNFQILIMDWNDLVFQTKEAGRGLVVFGSVLGSSAGPAGLAGQG